MRKAEREAHKMTSSSAAAPRKATWKELLEKRAAIFDDRADTKLSLTDKAVFQYREATDPEILEDVSQSWTTGQTLS